MSINYELSSFFGVCRLCCAHIFMYVHCVYNKQIVNLFRERCLWGSKQRIIVNENCEVLRNICLHCIG